MKKVKVGKKNLKIIAATSMAVFSLMATFTATFAWFVAHREIDHGANDFEVAHVDTSVVEISIHQFYGTSTEDGDKYYGFHPAPTSTIDYSDPDHPSVNGSAAIQLGTYSLDDPHHPVLLLFKIEGISEKVSAETIYPFLPKNKPGADELGSDYIVNTYAQLDAKKSIASDGDYFEVLHDESQNGTYFDDDTDTNLKVKTRYQYHASSDSFEFVWADLAMNNNPLSSAIQAHSFLFTFSAPYTKSGNTYIVDETCEGLTSHDYVYYVDGTQHTGSDQLGIWIPVNDFKDASAENTNRSSFVSFDSNGAFTGFQQEASFFDGDVEGYTYLGITIDYDPAALEYLSTYYLGHKYLNDGLTFKCDWVTKI